MATKKLYQELIREHYQAPRNRGELAQCNASSGMVNPSCGDTVTVQAYVENERLMRVAFTGSGCMISQAAASLWSEQVLGKSVAEIMALTNKDLEPLLHIDLGPYRARCAFLFVEALQAALNKK